MSADYCGVLLFVMPCLISIKLFILGGLFSDFWGF